MSDDLVYRSENRDLWVYMGLQAGYVNLGGFFAIQMLISHVTGSFSFLGQHLAKGMWMKSFFFFLILLAFLLGAFFAALATELQKKAGRPPAYPQMMLVLAGIFLGIVALGEASLFGSFGETVVAPRHYILLFLLAFCGGIQNAVITQYTRAVVRTTHLTGPLTDLGIGFAKVAVNADELERKRNTVRMEVMLSYIVGSFLGALAFPVFGFKAFLVPVLFSLGVGVRLFSLPRQM